MAKQMIYGEEARKKLLDGITAATDAIKVTLGPKAVSYTHLTLPTICSV